MSNPLSDLLQRGEGGYGSYNRGRAGDSAGRTIDFSQMTLAEVQEAQHRGRQDPDRLFAVGKYQIIPGTMDLAVRGLHLDPNQRFTPELQERIFSDYLISQKQPGIKAYITGQPGADLHTAQQQMAAEWASVSDPDTGLRRYGKVGHNRASISANQVGRALEQMRTEYDRDIKAGMKPEDAWRAVTASGDARTQGDRTQSDAVPARDTNHAVLKQGAHGAEVENLQRSLAALGYTGKDGKPLAADKNFGANTDHALRDFQQAHGIKVDGKAGSETQRALAQAQQHPLVSEATHPAHGLYAAIGAKLPPGTDPKVVANVTMSAVENGITSADKLKSVDVGADRNMAFLRGTNEANRTHVDLQAPAPNLQQSSDYLQSHANKPQVVTPTLQAQMVSV